MSARIVMIDVVAMMVEHCHASNIYVDPLTVRQIRVGIAA